MYFVISNKVHRQLRCYIHTVNIVLTFQYAVFCNCKHPLGLLKDKRLLVVHVFKLFV